METGLKAASDILIPQLKKAFASGGEAKSDVKDKVPPSSVNTHKSTVSRHGLRKPQMYSYQHPQNPVIPLQTGEGPKEASYYQGGGAKQPVKRKGEYFPQGYLPAIKFDHPLPGRPGPLPGGSPVLPPPGETPISAQSSNRHSTYAVRHHGGNNPNHGLGSPRDHINGFRPLFRPHTVDPNYNRPVGGYNSNFRPPTTSAFPGIDATLNLPAGFRSPASHEIGGGEGSNYPPIRTPSIQFTSPSNILPAESTTSASLGPAFAAVPASQERPPPSAIARPEVARTRPAAAPAPLLPSSSPGKTTLPTSSVTENNLATTTADSDQDGYYYEDEDILDQEYDGTEVLMILLN